MTYLAELFAACNVSHPYRVCRIDADNGRDAEDIARDLLADLRADHADLFVSNGAGGFDFYTPVEVR